MKNYFFYLLATIFTVLILIPTISYCQTGISVSPPRTYFTLSPGKIESKKILVSNPSKSNTLELSVSLNDWEYDSLGNNVIYDAGKLNTSSSEWLDVLPQSFFSIAPGASHEIELRMRVPDTLNTTIPVHTTMVFITQINPSDDINEQGANIKIAVRSGIKIYHRNNIKRDANIDITNFTYDKTSNDHLKLIFSNIGNVWADGTITCELLNQETGKKTELEDVIFYSMPGNSRTVFLKLPENLQPAKYIASAIINYEYAEAVKLAELSFNYEK